MSKIYDSLCNDEHIAANHRGDDIDTIGLYPCDCAKDKEDSEQKAVSSERCNGGCSLWKCGRPKGHSGPCQPKQDGWEVGAAVTFSAATERVVTFEKDEFTKETMAKFDGLIELFKVKP